jgi:hypothetical protein
MSAVEGRQEKDVPCATSTWKFANVDQLDFRTPCLSTFATYLQPRPNLHICEDKQQVE